MQLQLNSRNVTYTRSVLCACLLFCSKPFSNEQINMRLRRSLRALLKGKVTRLSFTFESGTSKIDFTKKKKRVLDCVNFTNLPIVLFSLFRNLVWRATSKISTPD